jgi:hypothetical protein
MFIWAWFDEVLFAEFVLIFAALNAAVLLKKRAFLFVLELAEF